MKSAINHISNRLHTHAFGLGVFAVLVGFFFFAGGLVLANGQTVGPSDSHVVSLYVDGQESAAPTRAATVGEFIKKAKIVINEADLVEPALKTNIDADNFRINIYHAKPVTIVDGSSIKKVMTPYSTPQTIAEKAGFTVYPEDKYNFFIVFSFYLIHYLFFAQYSWCNNFYLAHWKGRITGRIYIKSYRLFLIDHSFAIF